MSQASNNRFLDKAFVFNPSSELVIANNAKATALTLGQVGFYSSKTGNGIAVGTAPGTSTGVTNVTAPTIEIHQQLGDTRFGTLRTRSINAQQVVSWRAVKAKAAQSQIVYIGYDESDTAKTLASVVGDELIVVINIFDNELTKIYGMSGYNHRIAVDPTVYAGLAEGAAIDQSKLADWIVAYINGTDYPAGGWPTNRELKNFIVASKVNSGTSYGVKLVIAQPAADTHPSWEPRPFHRPNVRTITVGTSTGRAFTVTYSQKAKPVQGTALQAQMLEIESQGYNRVRDQFEDAKYFRTNFISRAVAGTSYDFYYLDYLSSHNDTGLPKVVTDPYSVVFIVPTGTGAALETLLNNWLTPLGFAAVDIDTTEAEKGTAEIENA